MIPARTPRAASRRFDWVGLLLLLVLAPALFGAALYLTW